jgi:hypothetical protein
MSISNQLATDIKKAMLAKDKDRLAALRAVKSAFLIENTKEDSSGEITNDTAIQIIGKLQKQRMDAYKIYVDQKRQDLAREELSQAKVLEEYLPDQMSEDELKVQLQLLIDQIGASSIADMGKVMGKAMGMFKGKADGSLISKTVKELLA